MNDASWSARLARYKGPDWRRSLWQLATAAALFVGAWALMYASLGVGGRRDRLDHRRSHPHAVSLLEEDPRDAPRDLGQPRAPRLRGHRHAHGGRVPRALALGAAQVPRV